MKYEELTRKEKQLLALEYPYKSDRQLWDTTLGKSQYDSSKFFNSPEQIEELKEIENWRQYRNQIVHAMFSKDIEVLRSNYKEHVEQGYQLGRYVDRQVQALKRV